jgi:KaiC/GvpD/RAD55 family RecA-like ATPase
MAFLESPDVESVAQFHVERIEALEESEMRRILGHYRRVRHDLRDRLDTLKPGTFTAQQLGGTLVQVEAAIDKMREILQSEVASSTKAVAEVSIDQLMSELSQWDRKFTGAVTPIDLDAVLIASETSNLLFNRHESSLRAYSQDLRAVFARELTNAVIANQTSSETVHSVADIVSRLTKMFVGEEWKLHRLVRTELHGAYNLGKISGMTEARNKAMPDLMKTLFHPMDHRTAEDSKHADKLNLIVPIDKPFEYKWNGKVRRYMAPPDRPNDRSILVPYRKAWGE